MQQQVALDATELASEDAAFEHRDLRATASELNTYHWIIWLRCALTFGAMVAYYYQVIPVWLLLVANVVLYPEIYLRIHDIGHATPVRRFGLVARFVPVSSPIWGGARIFATIHREHHQHLGTDRDPWLPYYTGHPLRALFFNFIEPEYSCREFIKRNGVDRELAANIAFNLATFVAGLAAFQWVYVVHVLSQRTVHMVGIFFFNFYTHRETLSARAAIGTWERADELKSWLPLFRLLWGRDTVDGLVYHNRHHCRGQQHIPVRSYKHLADTGAYSGTIHKWPITEIKRATDADSGAPPLA
jgi:hypothetical protein